MPEPYNRSAVVYEKLAQSIEEYMTLEALSNEEAARMLVRMATELTFAGIPEARPGFVANLQKSIIGLLEGTAEGLLP